MTDEADEVEVPAAIAHVHLSYEELEAFVDGRADALDRELVAAATAVCTLCRRELDDLAAMRSAMSPARDLPHRGIEI